MISGKKNRGGEEYQVTGNFIHPCYGVEVRERGQSRSCPRQTASFSFFDLPRAEVGEVGVTNLLPVQLILHNKVPQLFCQFSVFPKLKYVQNNNISLTNFLFYFQNLAQHSLQQIYQAIQLSERSQGNTVNLKNSPASHLSIYQMFHFSVYDNIS